MLLGHQLNLAIRLLTRYEEAWYPNSQAVEDIEDGLYWDAEKCCFSADLGLLLRGEAESVQIFTATEWLYPPTLLKGSQDTRNQFDAVVVDENTDVYFIRKVE